MISWKEILKHNSLESQPKDIKENLKVLHYRINIVRKIWRKPMVVTSGLRSKEDHLRIYKNIARRKGKEFDIRKVPMRSKHLFGQAIDIYDPNKQLQQWIKDNIDVMEAIGFWFESFDHTPNWVHFQIIPPGSGKRFFIP